MLIVILWLAKQCLHTTRIAIRICQLQVAHSAKSRLIFLIILEYHELARRNFRGDLATQVRGFNAKALLLNSSLAMRYRIESANTTSAIRNTIESSQVTKLKARLFSVCSVSLRFTCQQTIIRLLKGHKLLCQNQALFYYCAALLYLQARQVTVEITSRLSSYPN